MPSISNAGGSLTSALVLTLLAWGVRWLRAELNKNKKSSGTSQDHSCTRLGRFYARLSPASLRMLVEHSVQPHLVFDVRRLPADPLPSELKGALKLPADKVDLVLGSEAAWHEAFQGIAYPATHYVLVFVGDNEEEQHMGAARAAAHGYQRTLVLEGCLRNFLSGLHAQPDLRYIDREAVAVLLGEGGSYGHLPRALVLDVRRSEEQALYGSIKGSVHIPLDQLPSALMLPPEQFLVVYNFRKPTADDLLIMSSRTNNRSAWAAQLAKDAGLQRCLVHRQGVYGWHFEATVLPYRRFGVAEPPPDPEPFQVEEADAGAGRLQLSLLGLL